MPSGRFSLLPSPFIPFQMSRLKNDELRKLRSTFDQFRTEVESQMINLIQENDKLRCENGRLRMKMTQIERNGFLSEGKVLQWLL